MTAARELALVGGHFVAGRQDRWLEVSNPSDLTTTVGLVPEMDAVDAADVLAAAAEGQRTWSQWSPIDRGQALSRAAEGIRQSRDSLRDLIIHECGKMPGEADGEVTKAADFFDYYSGFGRFPYGRLLPDARPRTRAWSQREPVGTTVAITPFNDPLLTPARKLAPALVAGNAVILKPAHQTPLIAFRLAALLHAAGVAAGAINVLTGPVDPMLNTVIDDEQVAAVSFTGSTENGRRLGRRLAGTTTRLQAELGGKNTAVVLADADRQRAAETIVAAAFAQAGQRCTATSRVLVEESAMDELVSLLLRGARDLRVGPGTQSGSSMGPLIDRPQVAFVRDAVGQSAAAGATVLCGGHEPSGTLENGSFLLPTILGDVPPEAPAWTDELFGPVVAIRPTASVETAIAELNRSRYGLAASLFTADLDAADAFIQGVNTGQVAINLPTSGWDVHLPFGGFGDSGSGGKEQGIEALDFYTRVKSVVYSP